MPFFTSVSTIGMTHYYPSYYSYYLKFAIDEFNNYCISIVKTAAIKYATNLKIIELLFSYGIDLNELELANAKLSRNQINYQLYCVGLLSYFYYGNLYESLTAN